MTLILACLLMAMIPPAFVGVMTLITRVNVFNIYGAKWLGIFSFLAALLPVIQFIGRQS